jgi:hypothetical protein
MRVTHHPHLALPLIASASLATVRLALPWVRVKFPPSAALDFLRNCCGSTGTSAAPWLETTRDGVQVQGLLKLLMTGRNCEKYGSNGSDVQFSREDRCPVL